MTGLVDYGMGNLRSVEKALERAGAGVRRVTGPGHTGGLDALVVPGQGAFRDCSATLRRTGLDTELLAWLRAGKPFLGICLGLQALFDTSHENGSHAGLGFFAGTVERFNAPALKIPQIGWNTVRQARPGCPLFTGIPDNAYFYFDHSYAVCPRDHGIVAGETDYGGPFPSAVWFGRCFAVQFHPEKSQRNGIRLLENFLAAAR